MGKPAYHENVIAVRKQIFEACERVHRQPAEVGLIGVTKTVEAAELPALLESGLTDFGENRWQQARPKLERAEAKQATWHFIGTLQENKVKYIVKYFDLIHSIDSVELGQAVNAYAEKIGRCMDILVQVNIAGEAQKHGVMPDNAFSIVDSLRKLPNIQVRGLMTMAPNYDDPEATRPVFRKLAELKATIAEKIGDEAFRHLSMGMSQDYTIAVEEGATFVRVGRRLMEIDSKDHCLE